MGKLLSETGLRADQKIHAQAIIQAGEARCQAAGMGRFLVKPVDPLRLEELFRAMFPSGGGVSHTAAA